MLTELSLEERQRQRQLTIKPLVEAFFAWLKQHWNDVLPKSETGKGFTYCLNQEKYLKVFLEDGNIPTDNNSAESSIRGFCIGKRNWHLIDTIDGAKASAIIYSIAETAKADLIYPASEDKVFSVIARDINNVDVAFSNKGTKNHFLVPVYGYKQIMSTMYQELRLLALF